MDALIVATPSYAAASLLREVDHELAAQLQRIPHAPCAIVSLGYRREQIGHPLNGFGYVTPLVERRQVLSASFSSIKYRGRAPEDCELFPGLHRRGVPSRVARLSRYDIAFDGREGFGRAVDDQGRPRV